MRNHGRSRSVSVRVRGGFRVALRPAKVGSGVGSSPETPRRQRTGPSGVDWSTMLRAADAGARRAFDLILATTLLFLLSPLMLLAALLIRLDSRGPVFFRAERAGYRGRPLRMLKFRKMQDDAKGPKLTLSDDERFTRVGRWLYRTNLDEIPQLWHVVRGDMSLVGPRPEDPSFVEHQPDAYDEILRVRPGITGLSQVAFAAEGEILDDEDPLSHYLNRLLPEKLGLDRLYADRQSFALNLTVLLWTSAAVILRRPVAVHRTSGKMSFRRR